MITLNIISNLFSNDNFIDILTFSFISLVILFFVILYLAYRDKNKENKTNNSIIKINDTKKKKNNKIKEDITFEIPVISESLQQYKASIEESLKNNVVYHEAKPAIQNIKIKTPKHTKVLDIDKIEETFIEPKFNFDKINENFSRVSTPDRDMLPKKRQ